MAYVASRDPYTLPSAAQLREIAAKQDEKELQISAARTEAHANDQRVAAETIQKYYRGYRERRILKGYDLSPSKRWVNAIKDAQYQNATDPLPKEQIGGQSVASEKWRRARAVAQRARGDGHSSTSESDNPRGETSLRQTKRKSTSKGRTTVEPRSMGLEYFLEMVDHHHRYGSNLRAYHRVWQNCDTTENFFYWLDYGEGKDVDLENRPRKRLDVEKVRYLSKEERRMYRVVVDEQGLLCWAKNGERISTTPEYRDSLEGIVPVSDKKTPTWQETTGQQSTISSSDGSESSSGISVDSSEDAARYTNQELHDANGLRKLKHISANTVRNSLLRKTTKKNTWIFIADTSFHIYIGIKQSGYFQHSSLTAGGRLAAAGLIRIKHGQLRRLSPLSGHYSPPLNAFRQFVSNLRDAGVDMSRVSISRSYAVLTGLEGYLSVKRELQKGEQHVKDLLNPEEAKQRAEKEVDKSDSAKKERAFLEAQAAEQNNQRRRKSLAVRMKNKLGADRDER